MVSKASWTIQDYFKQAGVSLDGARRRSVSQTSLKGSENDFSRILAGAHARAQREGAAAGGARTIADYRKAPVAAKAPMARAPVVPRAATEPPAFAAVAAPAITAAGIGATDSQSSAGTDTPAPASFQVPSVSRQGPTESVNRQINECIEKAAADYRLPAELIRGVIQAESNFQVSAQSPAGAQGLMQLMPATARELGVDDPFDIRQNIDGGARYLRQMLDLFDGDVKQALSAYNAGPGTVMKYDGQVPYPETRNYVRKVMRYARS